MAEVVAAAVETARPLIDARQHRFTVTLRATSLRVKGDFARLAQILANLLNNAAKYTEPKRQHLADRRRAKAARSCSRVRDSGMGIPAESLSSIFDLFSQVRAHARPLAGRPGHRPHAGAGGWSRCRVEAFRCAASGHDRGSEFTVRLPAGSPAESVVAPAPPPVEEAQHAATRDGSRARRRRQPRCRREPGDAAADGGVRRPHRVRRPDGARGGSGDPSARGPSRSRPSRNRRIPGRRAHPGDARRRAHVADSRFPATARTSIAAARARPVSTSISSSRSIPLRSPNCWKRSGSPMPARLRETW